MQFSFGTVGSDEARNGSLPSADGVDQQGRLTMALSSVASLKPGWTTKHG